MKKLKPFTDFLKYYNIKLTLRLDNNYCQTGVIFTSSDENNLKTLENTILTLFNKPIHDVDATLRCGQISLKAELISDFKEMCNNEETLNYFKQEFKDNLKYSSKSNILKFGFFTFILTTIGGLSFFIAKEPNINSKNKAVLK